MNMGRVPLIFLVLMVVGIHQGSAWFSDIKDIIKFTYTVASKINEGKSAFDALTDDKDKKLDNIGNTLGTITQRITDITIQISSLDTAMRRMKTQIIEYVNFGGMLGNVREHLNNLAAKLTGFERKMFPVDNTICVTVNDAVKSGQGSIEEKLDEINSLVTSPNSISFFENFNEKLIKLSKDGMLDDCNQGRSQQQIVHGFYESLIASELRSLKLFMVAYKDKEIYCDKNGSSYNVTIAKLRLATVERCQKYMEIFKETLKALSLDIRRCEPEQYSRDKNFFELERLISHPIIVIRKKDVIGSTCYSIREKEKYRLWMFERPGRNDIICVDCQDIKSIEYCVSGDMDPYPYRVISVDIDDHGNKTVDPKDHCRKIGKTADLFTAADPKAISRKIKLCTCKCTNYEMDDKWQYWISLSEVRVNTLYDEVITGIRLKKSFNPFIGYVIHFEIKKAALMTDGRMIYPADWWESPQFEFDSLRTHTQRASNYQRLGTDDGETMYLHLDDINLEDGQVLVGVKFKVYEDRIGPGIKSIGIVGRSIQYNVTTNKLQKLAVTKDNIEAINILNPARKLLLDKNMSLPILSTNVKKNSTSGQYIRFASTDLVKDLGRATVPFFDMQDVETIPPSPLSGFGLYHKSQEGYGGFVALQLRSFNRTYLLDDRIEESEINGLKIDASGQ